MLGESLDENDGGKRRNSPLIALRRKLGKVLHSSHHSHGPRTSQENELGKRDSAYSVSSEGSDDGVGSASVTAENFEITAMSCQHNASSFEKEKLSMTVAKQCPGDDTKIPPDETIIHIMSQNSRQGDGLLQITDKCIGKDTSGQPVYEVNCQGKVGDPRTNLRWYFLEKICNYCNQVYLHMPDPEQVPSQTNGTIAIPQEMYIFRLCRFKLGDKYVLAAHKLVNPKPPFDKDNDGIMNICYHPSKGGMVTLQENSDPSHPMDGRFFGADGEGNIHFYGKSVCPGYCTNPFTLFNVYDEDGGRPADELKRANGE